MREKTLVIATDSYLPRWDGISRFLSEIVPRLNKSFKVIVIAPDFGKVESSGFRIVKIPLRDSKLGDYKPAKLEYWKIKDTIKKADIVFSQTIGPVGLLSIIAAKKLGKPTVSFIHSIEWELFPKAVSMSILKKILYPISKKLVRYAYKKSKLLIVPSESVSDMLVWQNILTPKKIAHLGVNVTKFCKVNNNDAKKKVGLDKNDFIIGYHGRLGFEKDLKTLLRAFIRIRNKHPNVKLLIVGEGVKEIENMLKSQKGVIMPGPQNNVIPWVQAMDLYVLPSLTETTSLSTLEAMACEIPVICTKVGFVKDYIDDGVNGLFFDFQNTVDLTKKIELLINENKLRSKMGSNARKIVIEKFKWDTTAKKIEKYIHEVLEK
jgi:phosphatidylinositol alpha 1,6-mannosyltransferase